MLTACTLTGVDARTDLDRLFALLETYPFAEFGILFSLSRGGEEPRYPALSEIEAVMGRAEKLGLASRFALHVCGRAVEAFLNGDKEVRALAARFGRVQINFSATTSAINSARINAGIADFPRPVITQHNVQNADISYGVSEPHHQLLIDASLGQGIRAASWPAPVAGKPTGYAGGIGPATIEIDLQRAREASAGAPFWIDMEGKIRTDDWFDLDLCQTVLGHVALQETLQCV